MKCNGIACTIFASICSWPKLVDTIKIMTPCPSLCCGETWTDIRDGERGVRGWDPFISFSGEIEIESEIKKERRARSQTSSGNYNQET